MSRHPSARLLVCVLVAVAAGCPAPPRAFAADPPVVACSAERPTVGLGGAVGLSAWASSPSGQSLRYAWEAAVGRLDSRGRQSRWDLAGLPPGRYAAAVRVSDTAGGSAECVVRVVVRQDKGLRGMPPPARETGSALLVAGGREAEGYGLYSY
ncbi:MAG TPA: hypothetical protein VFN71_14555, partial [Methylomirabilota bacterium]|nr:hypothetical protein [Methylomirabilota bacterium]